MFNNGKLINEKQFGREAKGETTISVEGMKKRLNNKAYEVEGQKRRIGTAQAKTRSKMYTVPKVKI